ncbi:hypothetical protein BJ166DRAFT_293326 [Pestalotiopsis sp. NC0098]|nr:hypothetical protein BJ166DRAFT_293326 [Pestalotiopsis sp. NC0098]
MRTTTLFFLCRWCCLYSGGRREFANTENSKRGFANAGSKEMDDVSCCGGRKESTRRPRRFDFIQRDRADPLAKTRQPFFTRKREEPVSSINHGSARCIAHIRT